MSAFADGYGYGPTRGNIKINIIYNILCLYKFEISK